MTERSSIKRDGTVRLERLEDMDPAAPLSADFRALSDAEASDRARKDPDAGELPPGFWDAAQPIEPESKEQITLRLDAEVLRHFRSTGKGYQSRINAVLRSYVRAQKSA